MPATAATNIVPFPAPNTPAWQLGLDAVVMYCVGRPGCGEMAAAVASPETKSFVMDAQGVEAAYSLLKLPPRLGLATLSTLKLPNRSVWVEHDRGRQRRGIQAETNADDTILLRHVGRAGPRALGMPAAWSLLDVRKPSPEIDQGAMLAKSPAPDPQRDAEWSAWFSMSFAPVRRDNRGMTTIEYKHWVSWALWDLAILHVLFAEHANGNRSHAGAKTLPL